MNSPVTNGPDGRALFVRYPLLAILCLALVSRVGALIGLNDLAFLDTSAYLNAGREIFSGQFVSKHIYTPLYPLFAHIFGGGTVLKIADIALSTATVAIVYELTRHLTHNRTTALIAALLMALYPHFVFFSIARLSETLFTFLLCLSFLLLYRARFNTASVVLVLAILTRPVLDYAAPCLIIVFSILVHKEAARTTIRRVFVYGIIYAVFMSPWWIHNYKKYDSFVRLSLGDGIVLYSGNNPMNVSGGGVAGGLADDDTDLSLFKHIRDPVERNSAMKDAALGFIADNPARFAKMAFVKLVRTWRLWPYAPEYQQPHIIAASLLSYGPVLLLFLFGLLTFVRHHWRDFAPVLTILIYLTAVHMVTIGSIRYRIPMEPFAILIAAIPLKGLLATVPFIRPVFSKLDAGHGTRKNSHASSDSPN